MKILRLFFICMCTCSFFLSFIQQKAYGDNPVTFPKGPFGVKITLDSEQVRNINESKNGITKLTLIPSYADGMYLWVASDNSVHGSFSIPEKADSMGIVQTGHFDFGGIYNEGKIYGNWNFSGTRTFPYHDEWRTNTETFEAEGTLDTTRSYHLVDGVGYFRGTLEGKVTWNHVECGKFSEDYSTCDKVEYLTETEDFSIDWIGSLYCSDDSYEQYCPCTRSVNGYEDSQSRFDLIGGTVEVSCAPKIVDWEGALKEQVLYVEDHIRTRKESIAIIHFEDMNTWVMKPETEIVIMTPPEKETKIGLVFGRLWNNTKKLLFEGTMEIETTQAVAGIKGTTFVLEADDKATTLKVISGTVKFTSKVSGESIDVTTGQEVVADAKGLGQVATFDIDAEKSSWESYISDPQILLPSDGVEVESQLRNSKSSGESSGFGGFRDFLKKNFGKICPGILPAAAVILLITKLNKGFMNKG